MHLKTMTNLCMNDRHAHERIDNPNCTGNIGKKTQNIDNT